MIVLRDTTLREGIQVPGSRVSLDEKNELLAMLDAIGVREIEIGLPNGMSACTQVCELIRANGYNLRPTALVPCYGEKWRAQIDLAADIGIDRVDILCPFSDHLLGDASLYGMAAAEIGPRVARVAEYAAGKGLKLSIGCMDATRTPLPRLLDIVSNAKQWGVSRLTVYDSVGISTSSRMKTLVEQVRAASGLPVLVHCHNDYGMATANTLAAIEGGAEAADVAVNGLGGRAGNASLEEVALALANLHGLDTGVNLAQLAELSALVERITGVTNSPLKPIVGEFCFAHSPVMHIRCIASGNTAAFEPFDPAQVGAHRTYDFCLDVDYTTALEPFVRESGCELDAEQTAALLKLLRDPNAERRGWTREQVIARIRQIAARSWVS